MVLKLQSPCNDLKPGIDSFELVANVGTDKVSIAKAKRLSVKIDPIKQDRFLGIHFEKITRHELGSNIKVDLIMRIKSFYTGYLIRNLKQAKGYLITL